MLEEPLSQLSMPMKRPAKHTPLSARSVVQAIGSVQIACSSGVMVAIAVNATKARMSPTLAMISGPRKHPAISPA